MGIINMKTATITEKGQISIPKEVRVKNFKKGSKVVILAFSDRIEIRPMKQISKKVETALASERSLAKDWDKEDKVWKDL